MTTEEYRKKLYEEIEENQWQYRGDKWRAYYKGKCSEMLSFMEEQNKKAGIFENSCNKGEHQHF